MKMVWVITRRQIFAAAFIVLAAVAAWLILTRGPESAPAGASSSERVIHMVTGEFSSTTEDGRKIESYRWDPGTVYVNKGETVTLRISGVNGHSHPFEIEGLDIRGEVQKGKETVVTFKADKEGIYRLVCYAHTDMANNGPMVGYIIVD